MPTRKTALVTGASRGIGLEVARRLASAGLRTVVTARDRHKAEEAARQLRDAQPSADIRADALDVTDISGMERRLAEIGEAHGPIDVLVNNAAILIDGPGGFSARLVEMSVDTLRETLEANLIGPALLLRHLLPGMIERGYGRIVNVSSRAGQLEAMGSGFPAYRISKAALNALTRIAASEAGAGNVKVNACSPGWTRTAMGGAEAPRSVEEGADTIVWLALLPADGPTGGFFEDRRRIAW